MRRGLTDAERFSQYTQAMPNGCVEWTGVRLTFGYGMFRVRGKASKMLAHRWAWEHANGSIPHGLSVLHKCDNPACVNTDHLFLGTYRDNAKDRESKGRGRQPKGSAHSMAKLTEEKVAEIRRRLACGETGRSLAREYGVGESRISAVKLGRRWRHVLEGVTHEH